MTARGPADQEGMGRLLAILLMTQLCVGCFVFEELDTSADMLDNPTFAKPEKKAAKPTPSPSPSAKPSSGESVKQQLAGWWNEARSINSGEVDENMVACELGGKTQYMGKTDCLTRGGNAGAVR